MNGKFFFENIWRKSFVDKESNKSPSMPKVSVVIATYNRAHLVSEAIESVLQQTFSDFEMILVNDASCDGTQEVLEKWAQHDSRIRVFHFPKNSGPSLVRNFGIK